MAANLAVAQLSTRQRSNLTQGYVKPWLKAARLAKTVRVDGRRHRCAALLRAAETRPIVVSARLSHSTISLAMDVYSHVLTTMPEPATQKVDDMFQRDGTLYANCERRMDRVRGKKNPARLAGLQSYLVRPDGIEPPTRGLGNLCSIH